MAVKNAVWTLSLVSCRLSICAVDCFKDMPIYFLKPQISGLFCIHNLCWNISSCTSSTHIKLQTQLPKSAAPQWVYQVHLPRHHLSHSVEVLHECQKRYTNNNWLVVEPTHLKNISQIGSSPQVRMKIKDVWNHHLEYNYCWWFRNPAFTSWGW